MAKCLNCGKVGKTRRAKNWARWQLCYKCAVQLHPEVYQHEKIHGTGYRYPKVIPNIEPMEIVVHGN